MVGTAVLRLSNCVTNEISSVDDGSGSGDVANSTTNDVTCENEPTDIAVTLALLVGIFMVRTCSK